MSSTGKIVSFNKNENSPPVQNKAVKFIGLTIVGLALFGLLFSSVFSGVNIFGRSELSFGRFGDKKIVYQYNNSFGQGVNNSMQEYEGQTDMTDEYYGFIRRMVWQQEFSNAALRAAMMYELEQAGYMPSSRAVDRRVVSTFQTDGRFDADQYKSLSAANKASLRDNLREQAVLETWYGDVLDSLYRSDASLDFLGTMKAEVKTYNYITLPFDSYPEDDVIQYGRDNIKLFQSMALSRITSKDETAAREVLDLYSERRQEIDAFAELAKEYSTDSYKEDGGVMGDTARHTLLEIIAEEDADAVFALAVGDTAGPFDTDYGWIIFHADGEAVDADPEASAEDIRAYMLRNEVGMIEDSLLARASELREKALSTGAFRRTAEADGLEVKTTEPFPFNFGGDALLGDSPEKSDDAQLTGTASSEEFWEGIAALKDVNDISAPIVLSNAIGLFSLASTETRETEDYWDRIVEYETATSLQADYEALVLAEDSKLFVDNFSETYNSIFNP
ncbi:MAG: hypothetical protein B0D92_05215 [Spirochaeta sp. LUC14_002_19_P3]|nr:MAG: hypothetical protein B0D92_05215 [Spirochaeta sp. LUC14_002_19_P3]